MDYKETPRTELIRLLENANETISKMRNEDYKQREEIKNLKLEIARKAIENVADIKSLQNMLRISNSGHTHNEKRYLTERTNGIVDSMVESKIKIIEEMFNKDLPF
jgi:hypothetical protein